MKKILIIADGILAEHFLEKIMSLKGSENRYTILAYKKKSLPKGIEKKYDVHFFDPTSYIKLLDLLHSERFYQIMIAVSRRIDAKETYKNIRKIDKDITINMLDRWDLKLFRDANLTTLQSKDVLVSRFADFLPDRPVTARNVGFGEGDIMEVRVPAGSSFLYRHLASIEQENWRIVAIYRGKKLLLSRPTLMIRPGDLLLLVGEPYILLNVYKSIKQELGQFPHPFGNNIYCLVDMLHMKEEEIDSIINDALLLHAKINSKKLCIRVTNPTYSKQFEKIRNYENKNIDVLVEYYKKTTDEVLSRDSSTLDIGLVIAENRFFYEHKEIFYEQKLPVLKLGIYGFNSIKHGIILATGDKEIERESSIILDFCTQLDLEINLYDFDPEEKEETKELVNHFSHLSKLFEKDVNIIKNSMKNPLIELQDREDFLQFIPFQTKILKKEILDLFSTDMYKLSHKLDNNYQIFIPVNE